MNGTLEQQNLYGWRKLLRYPKGQPLIRWLISVQDTPLRQVFAFIGFVIMFRILLNSWSLSVAIIVGMYLHEHGHGLVFRKAGIKYKVRFLFPVGAVAIPISAEEEARSDTLHYDTLAYLMHAGPAVNVMLMLAAKFIELVSAFPLIDGFARDFVFMNGLLAFGNLIPVWKLDAGQLAKLIFSSLDEQEEKGFLVVFFVVGGGIVAFLLVNTPLGPGILAFFVTLLARFGWISFILVAMFGAWRNAANDDPKLSEHALSMTNAQAVIHGLFWLIAGVITLLVFAIPAF